MILYVFLHRRRAGRQKHYMTVQVRLGSKEIMEHGEVKKKKKKGTYKYYKLYYCGVRSSFWRRLLMNSDRTRRTHLTCIRRIGTAVRSQMRVAHHITLYIRNITRRRTAARIYLYIYNVLGPIDGDGLVRIGETE
jgi:hypothetical protein